MKRLPQAPGPRTDIGVYVMDTKATAILGGAAAFAVTAGMVWLVNSWAPVAPEPTAPLWAGGFIGVGVLVGLWSRG